MPVAEAVVSERRRPSIVWLIPLVAAVVGAFVAWRTFSERGPEIRIEFSSAEGLEAGKTQIKFKDVEVGIVETIVLEARSVGRGLHGAHGEGRRGVPQGGHALLGGDGPHHGQPDHGARHAALGRLHRHRSQPRGQAARHFVGLATQPVITSDEPGKHFVLRSYRAGSVPLGSPVLFRKIQVGEVVSSELDPSGDFVTIGIFVHLPHDVRVTEDTRFWNASGFDVKLSAERRRARRRIAHEHPDRRHRVRDARRDGAARPRRREFDLYENEAATKRPVYTRRNTWLVYFDQSVRGLNPGAPVEFRGIQVGEVRDVRLEYDAKKQRFRIPVLVDIEPERLGQLGSEDASSAARAWIGSCRRACARSSRAGTCSPASCSCHSTCRRAPTPAEDRLEEALSGVPERPDPARGDHLERHPADQEARGPPAGRDRGLAGRHARVRARRARAGGAHARAGEPHARDGDTALGPSSPLQSELRRALLELSDAARSVGLAADQIERQPDSLIFGRGDEK